MTERVQGPASCFPAIEERYGRPVAQRQVLLRARPAEQPGARHMELVGRLTSTHGTGHGLAHALVGHLLAG